MEIHTNIQEKTSILFVLPCKSMTFGMQLRAWRKAKGMTQGELAAAVGYSESYISNLERDFSANTKSGKPKASERLSSKFAKVLGVPEDDVRVAAGHAPKNGGVGVAFAMPDGVRIKMEGAKNYSEEDRPELEMAFTVAYEQFKRRKEQRDK